MVWWQRDAKDDVAEDLAGAKGDRRGGFQVKRVGVDGWPGTSVHGVGDASVDTSVAAPNCESCITPMHAREGERERERERGGRKTGTREERRRETG